MKFHENPSSGSRVVPCGQTDMTNLTVAFHYLLARLNTVFQSLETYCCHCMRSWCNIGALLQLVFFVLLFIFIPGIYSYILFTWHNRPGGPRPHHRGFTIALRHTILGRTPPRRWSNRFIDLYLTAQNNPKRRTSVPPAGFEPTIPASE